MRVALTGGTGVVGGFVAQALQRTGHQIAMLSRTTGYHLGDAPDLTGHDALIHCAFAHVPGKYRGGEGDDPQAFIAANLDGTRRLFDAAAQAGIGRILFLSSRAVHDGHPAGTVLSDDLPPAPTTLYGRAKAAAEAYLSTLELASTSIRATGVYGPGRANKWRTLFSDYRAGHPITPRIATEVHGDDLAAAILLLLDHPAPPATVNVSDLVLDRRQLLAMVAELTQCRHPLPAAADASALRVLRCDALRSLGWRPGGMSLVRQTLPALLDSAEGAG